MTKCNADEKNCKNRHNVAKCQTCEYNFEKGLDGSTRRKKDNFEEIGEDND
jgi:hypothetical protein